MSAPMMTGGVDGQASCLHASLAAKVAVAQLVYLPGQGIEA